VCWVGFAFLVGLLSDSPSRGFLSAGPCWFRRGSPGTQRSGMCATCAWPHGAVWGGTGYCCRGTSAVRVVLRSAAAASCGPSAGATAGSGSRLRALSWVGGYLRGSSPKGGCSFAMIGGFFQDRVACNC
jgi:hypothetical protein